MLPLDITAIEQQARQLRAEEMQRINGLISARLYLYGRLLLATAAHALLSLGEILRPLFAWNPRAASALPARSRGLARPAA
ncbi:MAG: hypothetical protein NT083_16245 [Rhodocyclales bacterium]|jgi:hypothetical protein|nr:hypothetical protein [Rhodocyclales bacterium]